MAETQPAETQPAETRRAETRRAETLCGRDAHRARRQGEALTLPKRDGTALGTSSPLGARLFHG